MTDVTQHDLPNPEQAIGVFDSGVGGISVLKHIHALLPNEFLIYAADSQHAPYGNKSMEDIRARCFAMADFLMAHQVKAIVVACNTATAAAINVMREHYSIPIIGMEPAVKPAVAATKNGIIGVLATVGTLQSAQFAALLASYGKEVQVVTQGCPGLVECVEKGALEAPETLTLVKQYCQLLMDLGADTIVLGCTHYPFLVPLIREFVGHHVTLIETGDAVAKQLQHRLDDAHALNSFGLALDQSNPAISIWTNSLQPYAHDVITHLWQANAQEKACISKQALTIHSF